MGNSGRETRTALTDRDGDGDDKKDADGDDEGESGGRSVGITVPVRCFWSHLFYAGGAVSFPCLGAKAAESLIYSRRRSVAFPLVVSARGRFNYGARPENHGCRDSCWIVHTHTFAHTHSTDVYIYTRMYMHTYTHTLTAWATWARPHGVDLSVNHMSTARTS